MTPETNKNAYNYAINNYFDIDDEYINVPFEHLRKFFNALDKEFAETSEIENCVIMDFHVKIPIDIFF